MKAASYFGFCCRKCDVRISIAAVAGSDRLTCPKCGAAMEPDPGAVPSAANVYCPICRAVFGLVTSDRCPTCGGPFESVP